MLDHTRSDHLLQCSALPETRDDPDSDDDGGSTDFDDAYDDAYCEDDDSARPDNTGARWGTVSEEAMLDDIRAVEARADAKFARGDARKPQNRWYTCARCPVPESEQPYDIVVRHLKEKCVRWGVRCVFGADCLRISTAGMMCKATSLGMKIHSTRHKRCCTCYNRRPYLCVNAHSRVQFASAISVELTSCFSISPVVNHLAKTNHFFTTLQV